MGRNPKESPKAHSHAHVKEYNSLENRHCKAQTIMSEPKVNEIFIVDDPLMSRTFGADLRIR